MASAAVVAATLAAPVALAAPKVQLEQQGDEVQILVASRDTWVSSFEGETSANLGGARRLKIKGHQEFSLVDFDTSPLEGRVLRSAALWLHCDPQLPLLRVTVSTLSAPWQEGSGTGYSDEGGASFLRSDGRQQAWAGSGPDITAVMAGEGKTIWRSVEPVRVDERGWSKVPLDPLLVAHQVAGLSHGFALLDDIGTQHERDGDEIKIHWPPNRYCVSREGRSEWRPYLEVSVGAVDRHPPEPVLGLRASEGDFGPGEIGLAFGTPADRGLAGVVGFEVRLLSRVFGEGEDQIFDWSLATPVPRSQISLAGEVGEQVEFVFDGGERRSGEPVIFGVRAVDAAGNLGPVSTLQGRLASDTWHEVLPTASLPTFDAQGELPRVGGVEVAVVDPLDKVLPVSGRMIPERSAAYLRGNHLFEAHSKRIRLFSGRNEFVGFQVLVLGESNEEPRLEWSWRQPVGPRSSVEILAAGSVVTGIGLVPDPLLPIQGIGARLPTVVRDPIVARSYLVDIYVPHEQPSGETSATLTVHIGDQQLHLSVQLEVWDLVLPDRVTFLAQLNAYGLPEGANSRSYYREAHKHRTVLNSVPYNWRGEVGPIYGALDQDEPDWSAFEQEFGAMLDGSAFLDLPRRGVPLEALYLPLNENWPADIETGLGAGYWADTALSDAYRKRFVAGARSLAEHLAERNWHDTFFEFYLNNKLSHRLEQGWDASTAPWIFDEPVNTQDFWALRWYGRAFHEAVDPVAGPVQLGFRTDVSEPQWQRDTLDSVVDVSVVSETAFTYPRLIRERKRRTGGLVYNYGEPSALEASNAAMAAWCLAAWSAGMDGLLPWLAIGTQKAWQEGEATSLLYPGQKDLAGRPVPSLRLKALRRGQQDVEYLALFVAATSAPRFAVERGVVRRLSGASEVVADRGAFVLPEDLWRLRVALGDFLHEAASE